MGTHPIFESDFDCLTEKIMKLFNSLALASLATAEVYFKEDFSADNWEARWLQSKHKDDFGAFVLESDKWNEMKGLKTSTDAKFYASSAGFPAFTNKGKDLVVQFTVQHQQKIDCGGGYVKIFPSDVTAEAMHGESEYNIMFGPDICGYSTKKVHVIFNYKGKNHLINKDIKCKDDETTHIYTLIVTPDNKYKVLIDNAEEAAGALEEDWDVLPAKKIKDPEASKPAQDEWNEREEIADPDASKPEDWEKPEHIADPDATKPEDWDDEMDGEWKPRQIDNPDYKGAWVHPEIDNPEYNAADADGIAKYAENCKIGLDLWQVKSGTIFDNVMITDDAAAAKKAGEDLWAVTKDAEKTMKDAQDEEERKKADEESKSAEDDEDADDLDADEEDDLPEEDEEEEAEEAEHDEL